MCTNPYLATLTAHGDILEHKELTITNYIDTISLKERLGNGI